MKHSAARDIALLCLVWVAAVWIVNPAGNFPLNDDWSYARSVQRWVDEGHFQPGGWTAMSLVSQAAWGALFCLPTGFSFVALRLSTLTLGLAGVIGLYLVLRELRAGSVTALLGAALLAFNPLYFALAFTFMTDVPFTAAAVFSLLFFLRHLRTDAWRDLVLATLLAVAATLCRQIGLFLPAAFLPAAVIARRRSLRQAGLAAVIPLGVTAAVLIAYPFCLRLWGDVPPLYGFKVRAIVARVLGDTGPFGAMVVAHAIIAALYAGLFVAPLLVLLLPWPFAGTTRRSRTAVAASAALAIAVLAGRQIVKGGRVMPLVGNILTVTGIGPVTLHDVYILSLRHVPICPRPARTLITLAAIALGALLTFHLVGAAFAALFRSPPRPAPDESAAPGDADAVTPPRHRATLVFLLAACAIYLLPVLCDRFYDRYLVGLLPILCAALWAASPHDPARRLPTTLATVLCAAALLFSTATTHDYLAWNRARWAALNTLTVESGISPSAIDGGFEFNGWHHFRSDYQPSPGKSWWWVQDDLYVIGLGPIDGYTPIARRPFTRWLPPRHDEILVLRRNEAPPE